MHNKLQMKNKRAQIGETITWVVATVIIILILAISLSVSSFYIRNSKDLSFFKTTDTLASKSFFSYLLTKDTEGSIVYEQLKKQENLNEFNGNLGKKIFLDFYAKEHEGVWVGILTNKLGYLGEPDSLPNNYFGDRPKNMILKESKTPIPNPGIFEKIKLNENKFVDLVMSKFK